MPPLPHILPPEGPEPTELRRLSLEEAALCLARGGIVIFPTETLYAIGCRADKARACARLCALKGRPGNSPLPLLASDREQAARAVRLEVVPPELLDRFWPGPLSLLVPARSGLARETRNGEGLAALRVSPHPLAARLAALAGGPLTASSANFSGAAPAARARDLDPGLLAALARCGAEAGFLVAASPEEEPRGGAPSTLVQACAGPDGRCLRVLREGAVSAGALEEAGFRVIA